MQLEYIWFATMACNSRRIAPLKDKMSQIKSFHLRPPLLDKGLIRVRSHLNSRKSSSPQMKTVRLRLTQELSRKLILFLKRKYSPRRKVRLRTLVQTHQKKIKQSNYSNREKIMRWFLTVMSSPKNHHRHDFKYGEQIQLILRQSLRISHWFVKAAPLISNFSLSL